MPGKHLHVQESGSRFPTNLLLLSWVLQRALATTRGSTRLQLQHQQQTALFKRQSHSLLSGQPLPWPGTTCAAQRQNTLALSALPVPPHTMAARAPTPGSNGQCPVFLLAAMLVLICCYTDCHLPRRCLIPPGSPIHSNCLPGRHAIPGLLPHTCCLHPIHLARGKNLTG